MIHRFIASEDLFQIDLSIYQISIVEENHWFADTFFTKFTFPIEMYLDDELAKTLGYLLDSRYQNGETLFQGMYVHNDKMESAIFEIEEMVGNKLTASFRYGFDELPSFSKKLSELSLDKFELPEGQSIYAYAKTIIPQTWPAVNFNFPQIHTDKYDIEQEEWFAFGEIINNYKDGEFLINEVDVEDVTYNRNIMQPLPSYLHILQRGFADAGKVLMGDLLHDPIFQKKLLFCESDYATTLGQESYPIIQMGSDATIEAGPNGSMAKYSETVVIANPGRYRIVGKVYLRIRPKGPTSFKIKYRNTVLGTFSTHTIPLMPTLTININATFDTISDLQENTITFESTQKPTSDSFLACDLSINPIRLHDESGEAIPSVINQNKIDLTRAVPDITFRDFVTYIKNKYNVHLEPRGENEMWMNFIQGEVASGNIVDLSCFEVPEPEKKYNRGLSFLLKFQDIDSKDYTFQPVFHSAAGVATSSYKTDEKTLETTLEGLPLPLMVRHGVQTAHAFESGNSKMYSVMYGGLIGGLNLAMDPSEIMLPAVHARHHEQWINDRLAATTYPWQFKMFPEELRNLKVTSRVFGYGRNHVVKTINKTQLLPDLWEIDLETDTMK